MIRHQIDNFLSTLIGVTQLCILCFWKGSEINKITPFSPVSMTNMLVDFIKRATPVNFFVSPTETWSISALQSGFMTRGMEVGLTFEVLWCCHVCIRVLVCWENFPDIVNCTSNIGKNWCRYRRNRPFIAVILYLLTVLHTYNYHFIFGKSTKSIKSSCL